MTNAPPVRSWRERDGLLARLRLDRPKANVLDAAMVGALDEALAAIEAEPPVGALLLDHEGPHFSFGASVEEHLPDQCAAMLKSFHSLIRRLAAFPAPVLTVVRGQCLGGGMEVALAGHFIFASPSARFGQPEIQLGVFAPAASVLLPPRVGQARAEDLLFSGRTIEGTEAQRFGLVDVLADDPEAAALAWYDAHLAPKSASSLGMAVRAARGAFVDHLSARLVVVEELYLAKLMSTRDANEGLEAFLAKRAARWEHR